ncbi:uncharacterized protein BDV17DRAFT_293125 [Aspergillus undulatus]|uniref:uncharacterized protein n=1 Tax=Aspergillus undulatus TaxID=1810928 RepID=UPI003CCE02F2
MSRDHTPILDAQTGRLLPSTFDELATSNPDCIFGEFIDSPMCPGGIDKLTYERFAKSINQPYGLVDEDNPGRASSSKSSKILGRRRNRFSQAPNLDKRASVRGNPRRIMARPPQQTSILVLRLESRPAAVAFGGAIYHTSSVTGLTSPTFTGVTSVFPPLHIPVGEYTPDMVVQWLRMARCETALMLPSTLSLVLESAELEQEVCKLRKVFYIGAPLSTQLAKTLTPQVRIATLSGTTEEGYFLTQETDLEDYEYFCVDAARTGIHWNQISPDANLYEMQRLRMSQEEYNNGQRHNSQLLQPQYVFLTLPDREQYTSGDIFSKHPSKPDHWKYEGRIDDQIPLSMGQNVYPGVFEERVAKHRRIQSATLVESGREQVVSIA